VTRGASAGARDGYLDVLRIVGVVAVVVGHLPEQLVPRAAVYSWHVPLFFLLSGYLLSSRRSVLEDARHRVRTLVVPYLSWMVLVTLGLGVIWAVERRADPGVLLWAAWGGRYATSPYTAFWFVSALFVAVVVARLIHATRLPMVVQLGVGAVLLLLTVALPETSKMPLAVSQGLACVLFVQAGAALRQVVARLGTMARAVGGGTSLAVGIGLVATSLAAPLDLKVLDAGTPVISVVAALAIVAGAVLLPVRVTGRAGATASTLAAVSLPVVLLHPLVIMCLGEWSDLSTAAVLAVTILVCWLVALAISRTPLAPYLGAVVRRARSPIHGGAPVTR
jgi:acyltransferase